jgi:hypothetical protein
MRQRDDLEDRIDQSRNELESYIFQLQNGLDRDFPEFFDPEKVAEYGAKLAEVNGWFQEHEFERLGLTDYEGKLAVLKRFGEPARQRRLVLQQLPATIADLKERAAAARSRLASTDERHAHITAEERAPLIDEIEKYMAALDADAKAAEEAPKFRDCAFNEPKAQRDVAALEDKVTAMLGRPKPKPKPKEEAGTDATPDAEAPSPNEKPAAEPK